MKKIIFYILAVLSTDCFSADIDGNYSYHGYGTKSCGSYLAAIDSGNSSGNWGEYAQFGSWVTGYISAYNKLARDTFSIRGNTDFDGYMKYLEKHCNDNPLEDFHSATQSLIQALRPSRYVTAPR